MKPRFNRRLPGEPSVADELLERCYSLELKIHKFPESGVCLGYEMKGEIVSLAEADEYIANEDQASSHRKAKRVIRELLAAMLDDDEGRAES